MSIAERIDKLTVSQRQEIQQRKDSLDLIERAKAQVAAMDRNIATRNGRLLELQRIQQDKTPEPETDGA